MIEGLQKSVPIFVKGCPITAISGEWLAQKMASYTSVLASIGFKVPRIVTDNHAANVNAFKKLHSQFYGDGNLFIRHPDNQEKVYLFFDNVC